MTYEDFKKLVSAMRTAQNGYFKTSRIDAELKLQYMIEAKVLEAKVDKFLREEGELKLF